MRRVVGDLSPGDVYTFSSWGQGRVDPKIRVRFCTGFGFVVDTNNARNGL